MSVTIIAAVGHKGAIGAGGKLPWSIAEDMAHFKATTMGHAVVMGRKTWDSLPAKVRPLPGRTNCVVSRGPRTTLDPEVWLTVSEEAPFAQAIKHVAHLFGEVFIIGGAQVYAEALPLADVLLLTIVDMAVPDADAFFPGFDPGEFPLTSERQGSDPRLTFRRFERRS